MLRLRSPFVCYKLDEVIVAAAFPYCAHSCRNTEQPDQLFGSLYLEVHSRRIATSRLPHLRHLTESEDLGQRIRVARCPTKRGLAILCALSKDTVLCTRSSFSLKHSPLPVFALLLGLSTSPPEQRESYH